MQKGEDECTVFCVCFLQCIFGPRINLSLLSNQPALFASLCNTGAGGSSDCISHLPVSLVLSPVHRGHWTGTANLEEKEGTFSPSVLVFFLVARGSACRDPGRVSERGRWLSGWAAGTLQHGSTPCLPRCPGFSLAGTLPLGF